jgi:hypothetical protein
MPELKYPQNKTYYIAHNNIVVHYGSIDSIKVMTTGLQYLETFEDVNNWISRLADFNIVIPEEELIFY